MVGRNMKRLYRSLFIIWLILLALFCVPPMPSNLPFVDRLALHPDKWELKLNDPDHTFFPRDSESGKSRLLSFLQRYRHTYMADVGWFTTGLVVASVFSLVGWIREKHLEKKYAEPSAPAIGRGGHR